jgi:hypothetical protein
MTQDVQGRLVECGKSRALRDFSLSHRTVFSDDDLDHDSSLRLFKARFRWVLLELINPTQNDVR